MKTDTDRALGDLMKIAVFLFLIAVAVFFATGCSKSVTGAKGDRGSPAAQPMLSTSPATTTECPTGGLEVVSSIGLKTAVIGVVCNGAPGPVGAPGVNGSDGRDGNSGSDGKDGQDGTKIEFIQFCAGAPSYPSEFPEVGIKVGSSVYAVYSTHGGFLTYLPPGAYLSDAVGSSCNFVINSDGSITR